jgi:hypothetical protein
MRRETSSPPKGGGARSSDLVDAVWVEREVVLDRDHHREGPPRTSAFVERSPPTGMLK